MADATMANRRLPLATVPNAVNSPVRAGNVVAAVKRTRVQTEDTHDVIQSQPPAKRQMLQLDQENVDPRTDLVLTKVDDLFPKRSTLAQPTPLERKLAASREKIQQPASILHQQQQPLTRHPAPDASVDRQARLAAENLESIRQWQRHYRRQFPSFTFYLDGVPEDVRARCNRQIRTLGAREEKFFSKAITHLVTARQIPTAATQPHALIAVPDQKVSCVTAQEQGRTTTTVLDHALQKRLGSQLPDAETRKLIPQAADVLTRARDMGIKIWTLEKLQRILRTMFETDTNEQGTLMPVDATASTTTSRNVSKPTKDAELKKLLRHDQINGDANAQEMITFKGHYIYIHDMDEKTRPVMARDYPKPANKIDGKWPQFHVTAQGRCPFVEDQSYSKQQQQEAEQHARAQRDLANQRRTRGSATSTDEKQSQPLGECSANLRRSPRKSMLKEVEQSRPLDPPRLIPTARRTSQEGVPLFAQTNTSSRALPKMIGGMPVASGLQQSNITSAIRSQVVSSTAISSTAPGMSRRLTESKEITALKRKVLERGASAHSQAPSSYFNDMRAAINDESAAPPARAAKRKAQETILGVVHEDAEITTIRQKSKVAKKSKSEKDPKVGYCENCRDKFDDFEEHILSRKHQKFARAAENFKELDALLAQLKRPHKHH